MAVNTRSEPRRSRSRAGKGSPAVLRGLPLAALLAIALAAAGCERRPELDPRPVSLEPAGSDGAAPTPVVIRGTGFHARAVQDGAGGISSADSTHRAWLDDTLELADVTWVDAFTLRATVPAGLALGPHSLTVENALGRRGRLEGAFTVIVPTSLAATATAAPAIASTGQTISVEVTVTNPGGAAVLGVAPEIATSGTGAASALPPPDPVDLAPGERRTVTLPFLAEGSGDVSFSVEARGTEAFTGRLLSASASAGPILVERAAVLRGTLSLPSTLSPVTTFAATLLVTNEGEAAAVAVAPAALGASAGNVALFSVDGGPTPPSATIPGGGSQTFTWPCTLLGPGRLVLTTSAEGTDANGGWPVATGVVESNASGQTLEVVAGPSDPFGDGLAAGSLALFRGRLHWGPSLNGARFWADDPASPGNDTTLGIAIGVDVTTPNRAANYSLWPGSAATTIGAAGCVSRTLACGPNDERGLGVLAAGTMGGAEWLLLAGAPAASGGQYLYLAPSLGDPVAFRYVDLGRVSAPKMVAPSAALFAPTEGGGIDRLYAGFSGLSGNGSPVLLALTSLPPAAGLEAAAGTHVVDLRADIMPSLGGGGAPPNLTSSPRVDVVFRSSGTLYVANNGGIMRSTVPEPRPYFGNPGDWSVATPGAAPYAARASLESTRTAGLGPADRAFPALAAFGSCGGGPCLFAARNVTGTSPAVVPQLWKCDPAAAGDPVRCDPADWTLVAPNESLDATLTQLEDPANGAISVLVATPRYLYVGFDNAVTGVQLYRTDRVPSVPTDLRGRDGCAAGTPGCEGLGGNGFGDPAAFTRFLDAEVSSGAGGTSLFVLAGNGAGPSRLFTLPE